MKEDIRYIKILLNIIIVLLAFVLIGITTLGECKLNCVKLQ